jgi:hypothetical protein
MTFKTVSILTCDHCHAEMDLNGLVTLVEARRGYVSGGGQSVWQKLYVCNDCTEHLHNLFPTLDLK